MRRMMKRMKNDYKLLLRERKVEVVSIYNVCNEEKRMQLLPGNYVTEQEALL